MNASEHQSSQMARNPRQNKSLAQPSAAATQSLAGMAASAKSKGDAGRNAAGGLRAPKGSASPAADPIRRKSGS